MYSVPGLIDHNYFNPRSPWGSDIVKLFAGLKRQHFNPRSPWGSDVMGLTATVRR